jgi:hypothetical protein
MKGYRTDHNVVWKIGFDPRKMIFVEQRIQHQFLRTIDNHARRLAEDVGLDADALQAGRITLRNSDGQK